MIFVYKPYKINTLKKGGIKYGRNYHRNSRWIRSRYKTIAGQTNYCAAKAGLIGFSKALAKEVASRGITVNVVAPGFIATDMTEVLSEELKNNLLTQIPAGRLGEPKDIAKAVAFLSSEDASYINGTTLHVNGGMYMS